MLKVTMTASSFHDFAVLMQQQAILKNNPNIVAGSVPTFKENKPKEVQYTRSTLRPDTKVFVSNTRPIQGDTSSRHNTEKHCLFHDAKGHDLAACKAFNRKTLAAKTDWMRGGLCFKCLSSEHQSKDCNTTVTRCFLHDSPRQQSQSVPRRL